MQCVGWVTPVASSILPWLAPFSLGPEMQPLSVVSVLVSVCLLINTGSSRRQTCEVGEGRGIILSFLLPGGMLEVVCLYAKAHQLLPAAL